MYSGKTKRSKNAPAEQTEAAVKKAVQASETIPATLQHDAGAIARCSYCGRYTTRNAVLSRPYIKCDCGKTHGWCGSFKKPDAKSRWCEGYSPADIATVQRAEMGSGRNFFILSINSYGVTRTLHLNGKVYQDNMKPDKSGDYSGPRGIEDNPELQKVMDTFDSDELYEALQALDGTDLCEALRQLEEE